MFRRGLYVSRKAGSQTFDMAMVVMMDVVVFLFLVRNRTAPVPPLFRWEPVKITRVTEHLAHSNIWLQHRSTPPSMLASLSIISAVQKLQRVATKRASVSVFHQVRVYIPQGLQTTVVFRRSWNVFLSGITKRANSRITAFTIVEGQKKYRREGSLPVVCLNLCYTTRRSVSKPQRFILRKDSLRLC